jgi:spore coat polysaccharide biosynthesis predicted glycosyltransferase SpsG
MLGIRVASSFTAGRGHIARCEAIRAHFNESVTWFADPQGVHDLGGADDTVQVERETESIDALQVAVNAGRVSMVLLDSYLLKPEAIATLSRSVPCLAICDFPPFPDVHRVVAPQAFQKSEDNIYGGLEYQIVSAGFSSYRGKSVAEIGDAARILVSFGARDSSNRTALVLSALELVRRRWNISVTCVLGDHAPHRDDIRQRLVGHADMSLMEGVHDMGPLYATHNLAIGAPGISQAERAFCGLPSLLIAQNEAQKPLCRAWADLHAASISKPDLQEIAERTEALIGGAALRNDLRCNAMRLVDGAGAKRIADLIREMMK